ncbi:enoyl-CoA hydratase [Roseivivax jejudonensis]|nr:enoyl-CoA hydratase [Roseivivax jejudonensis]
MPLASLCAPATLPRETREDKMSLVLRHDTGAVRSLTLNDPDRLNALSDDMLAALLAECDALETAREIRVVTLGGAGRAFCAGHDLREMQAARQAPDDGRAAFADLFDRCATVMQRLRALPQPVIARVHGVAAAAGCQLVATCDLAVAAEEARFGVNGVNIGLFCSTPMVALSRNVPAKHAFEMLVTGGFADATRAREIGLVNRVVPAAELESASAELADTVAGKLGSAVRIGKSAFYRQGEMSLADAYDYTREVMVENMMNDGTNEGIAAFLEKRDPKWSQ